VKYLHTMVRVTDLDASLEFYCKQLGLEELRGLTRRHRLTAIARDVERSLGPVARHDDAGAAREVLLATTGSAAA